MASRALPISWHWIILISVCPLYIYSDPSAAPMRHSSWLKAPHRYLFDPVLPITPWEHLNPPTDRVHIFRWLMPNVVNSLSLFHLISVTIWGPIRSWWSRTPPVLLLAVISKTTIWWVSSSPTAANLSPLRLNARHMTPLVSEPWKLQRVYYVLESQICIPALDPLWAVATRYHINGLILQCHQGGCRCITHHHRVCRRTSTHSQQGPSRLQEQQHCILSYHFWGTSGCSYNPSIDNHEHIPIPDQLVVLYFDSRDPYSN